MKVKNIVVSDKDGFLEFLIQDLIKNEISYVQIENEVHFLDCIYRFFDISEQIEVQRFIKKIDVSVISICSLFEQENIDYDTIFSDFENNLIDVHSIKLENKDSITDQDIPRNSKRMIKQQNLLVNQRLKQFKR